MSRLRELFEELGLADVETFIASGNVLFTSRATDRRALERRIAAHLQEALGYEVETFLRMAEEVVLVANQQPFRSAESAGDTVHVGFFHEPLAAELARKLEAIRTTDDAFRVGEREFYWLCRVRTSDSKIWSSPALKALKLPVSSMRNMTSIRKLVAKHFPGGAAAGDRSVCETR